MGSPLRRMRPLLLSEVHHRLRKAGKDPLHPRGLWPAGPKDRKVPRLREPLQNHQRLSPTHQKQCLSIRLASRNLCLPPCLRRKAPARLAPANLRPLRKRGWSWNLDSEWNPRARSRRMWLGRIRDLKSKNTWNFCTIQYKFTWKICTFLHINTWIFCTFY